MIRDVAGIHKIRMVYLQLLYRCNFECQHCFHGERLQRRDAFSPDEAISFLRLMRGDYAVEAVTFLGGEPIPVPGLASDSAPGQTAARPPS
jgi:Fe-coproporphyrin III synthase